MTDTIQQLTDKILEENPMHRRFMESSLAHMSAAEKNRLTDYIAYCTGKGLSIDYLAEAYLTIVLDTLKEQMFFHKHGKYRHSSFADVANNVYFNDAYMSHYMYGLALTSFLWPNHLAMFRFFEKTLPRDKAGSYLEIGPGHGYYLMTATKLSAYDNFLGVDISQTSIEQTRAMIEHFSKGGEKKPFDLKEMDFLQSNLPDNAFDAVVMGEVLEHVEQPELFLQQIARVSKPDAYVYVTTCINAPAVDHIYLFRDTQQLEKMFEDNGLAVADSLICPYEGKTLEESIALKLAVNVAYVLRKK